MIEAGMIKFKKCIRCGSPVSPKRHEEILKETNRAFEGPQGMASSLVFDEALGLIHLTGEDSEFDPDGRVVLCSLCALHGMAESALDAARTLREADIIIQKHDVKFYGEDIADIFGLIEAASNRRSP